MNPSKFTDMEAVVGAQAGNYIIYDKKMIAGAIEQGVPVRFLSRWEMKFMSAAGLGREWNSLAKAPTLFYLKGDNVYAPDGKLLRKKTAHAAGG